MKKDKKGLLDRFRDTDLQYITIIEIVQPSETAEVEVKEPTKQ